MLGKSLKSCTLSHKNALKNLPKVYTISCSKRPLNNFPFYIHHVAYLEVIIPSAIQILPEKDTMLHNFYVKRTPRWAAHRVNASESSLSGWLYQVSLLLLSSLHCYHRNNMKSSLVRGLKSINLELLFKAPVMSKQHVKTLSHRVPHALDAY